MQRALYKGEIGFERHVGWCIIAHSLLATELKAMERAALDVVAVGETNARGSKTSLQSLGKNCSDKSGNWRRRPFTDLFLRLTAGVEIQAAAAIMMAQSTAQIYI